MGGYIQARGRVRISARNPRAAATCDRCGCRYNHSDLRWQHQWGGSTLQNLRILVCDRCLDVPNPQLRVFIMPPDPLPIRDPRPELDAGWQMQTYPLRDNFGNLIRMNDDTVITVIGPAGQEPHMILGSDGGFVADNGVSPSPLFTTEGP
jgi:hypothetical protein